MPSHLSLPSSALSKQNEAAIMLAIEGYICSLHHVLCLAAAQVASGADLGKADGFLCSSLLSCCPLHLE